MASERTSRLTNLDPAGLGGGGRERKGRENKEKGRKGFRESVSTFSLGFSVIGPSKSGET